MLRSPLGKVWTMGGEEKGLATKGSPRTRSCREGGSEGVAEVGGSGVVMDTEARSPPDAGKDPMHRDV